MSVLSQLANKLHILQVAQKLIRLHLQTHTPKHTHMHLYAYIFLKSGKAGCVSL